MQILFTLFLVAQIISALVMIGLVLVQHGKGADMGASFGSGTSGSLFGATGSANFLSRSTAICATVFFVCTLALAYLNTHGSPRAAGQGSVLDRAVTPAAPGAAGSAPAGAIPAAPAGAIPTAPAGATPATPAGAIPAAPAGTGAAAIPAPAAAASPAGK
jgi:preprotein translocase subunit SecG